jgi:serine/threonine protein kinase
MLSSIGSGGCGSVFLAEDKKGKHFALKVIAPVADLEAIASFRQEIENTSGLDHPNILRVFGWGSATIKGQPGLFIIPELRKRFCMTGRSDWGIGTEPVGKACVCRRHVVPLR